MLRLGQGYLEAARLPRMTRQFMQSLSMATGETVNVSALDGHEVVYIARSNSPRVGSSSAATSTLPGLTVCAGARAPA
jgi:IclR family transcriptional regulator, pca regulon regulatory protein